ncbi:hypothetical protein [Bacteroides sp.]|uniref:hypothetical protein n=1 Tax=Bacteroides sp. TaxID=29523 RepID=UPI002A7EDC57|nr:hypothetical protein [Bacteroides sp.]
MRKEILDALKAKFPGVSEAILNRIADKLSKTATTAEQVATAVEGVTIQQVIDSYGDSRATEAQQTAVSNYEKKHGLKDGQKVQGGAPASEPSIDTQPAAGGTDLASQITAAVTAAIKPLQDEITALKSGKVSETRQQKLNDIIGKLPENLRKPYTRIPVKDMTDEEFATLTTEVTAEVDGLLADVDAKGAVFGKPTTGSGKTSSGKEPTKDEVDAVAKAMGL